MPRTTFDLDPSVLRELRRRWEREGKSSEVLARALAEVDPARPGLAWNSENLGTPRVNLEDKDAVRALLDGDA